MSPQQEVTPSLVQQMLSDESLSELGLDLNDRVKLIKLYQSLRNDESRQTLAIRKYLESSVARSARMDQSGQKMLLSTVFKLFADAAPEDPAEMKEKALKRLNQQKKKASDAIGTLTTQADPNEKQQRLISFAQAGDLTKFLGKILDPKSDLATLPIKARGSYLIFGNALSNQQLNNSLTDYVNRNASADLGESIVNDKDAAERAIESDVLKFFGTAEGKQALAPLLNNRAVSSSKVGERLPGIIAKQLAYNISSRSQVLFHRGLLQEADTDIRAIEAGGEGADAVIARSQMDRLEEAVKNARALHDQLGIPSAFPFNPNGTIDTGSSDDADKLPFSAAGTAAGSFSDMIQLFSKNPEAARQFMSGRNVDPITTAVFRFQENRLASAEDPRFLLWRQQTGSTGEGAPSYNEYSKFLRQTSRAQRGGMFGPTTRRTGDVRLIAYTDRKGAVDTDSGALYFFRAGTGESVPVEEVAEVGDAAVREADVVLFDFQARDARGKPVINERQRNQIGVAISGLGGARKETVDALRSEGARVLYDKRSGEFVVLDKDRKVLAKDVIAGNDAQQLMDYASNSKIADVLGTVSGFRQGKSDNRAETGSLKDLQVGDQETQSAAYIPKGFGYTVAPPTRYTSGEVVYVPGQGLVVNIMDKGAEGRGDERLISIPAEDILFSTERGVEGYREGVKKLTKMLEDQGIEEDEAARILEEATFKEEEFDRAFRRPLRAVLGDLFKGRERRAKVTAREATLPMVRAQTMPEAVEVEEEAEVVEAEAPTETPTAEAAALRAAAAGAGAGRGRGAGGRGAGRGRGAGASTVPTAEEFEEERRRARLATEAAAAPPTAEELEAERRRARLATEAEAEEAATAPPKEPDLAALMEYSAEVDAAYKDIADQTGEHYSTQGPGVRDFSRVLGALDRKILEDIDKEGGIPASATLLELPPIRDGAYDLGPTIGAGDPDRPEGLVAKKAEPEGVPLSTQISKYAAALGSGITATRPDGSIDTRPMYERIGAALSEADRELQKENARRKIEDAQDQEGAEFEELPKTGDPERFVG